MKAFTKLLNPEDARREYAKAFAPKPLGSERVPLSEAFGRVLAEEIRASTDLPSFARSTVDGFALRAAETAQAASGRPVTLEVVGDVSMGAEVEVEVDEGEAARIPTGGALPAGTDAVVMQEHIVRQDETIAVERPIRPGENVTPRGSDVRAGEPVLSAGRRLRAQEVGLLAGLGRPAVEVYLRPRVGVIVTGDELVPPDVPLRGSQVHDMNSYTLAGLIVSAGAVAKSYGIVRDNLAVLARVAQRAHRVCDVLLLSGGSSVGEKDVVAEVIAALGDPGVVVHGISIRPGKPTMLGVANGKPVFGVPGNPVSAMVVFDQFIRPVLDAMVGVRGASRPGHALRARLAGRLVATDREDHVRVALDQRSGGLWAVPVPGGSATITSMVRADGIVVVPARQAFEEGTEVEVRLLA